MIPYRAGRTPLLTNIVTLLNAGYEYIAVTPEQITAVAILKAQNPTLLQAQKAVPNTPGGFVPWKLGTPSTQIPQLTPAICWMGHGVQSGTAAPVLTEDTSTGLVLSKARTSTGTYNITGFPTGYSIHASVQPYDANASITVAVAGQTVTIRTFNAGTLADAYLTASSPIQFILMPA